MKTKKILVAVTGASGMLYLQSFLEMLSACNVAVHGICSSSGDKVLAVEAGIKSSSLATVTKWFKIDDFTAPPASGSSNYDAMVILPCTMGTLAAVAGGLSFNLIHRAADVMLKERRTLVMAVRETPLNRTHLTNMLAAHDAGAVICPPMPSFYLKPTTLEEATLTWCWRLADQLGIPVDDRKRWGGEEE